MTRDEIPKCRACLGTGRTPTKAGGAAYTCGFCVGKGWDFNALPDPRVIDILSLHRALNKGSKQDPYSAIIPKWLLLHHREDGDSLIDWLRRIGVQGVYGDRTLLPAYDRFVNRYVGNYYNAFTPGIHIFYSHGDIAQHEETQILSPEEIMFLIRVCNWAKGHILTTFDPGVCETKNPLDYIEF